VTILAATELTGYYNANTTIMESNIAAALATVTDGGVSTWRVPTRDEAHLIYDAQGSLNLSTSKYFFRNNSDELKPFDVSKSSWMNAASSNIDLDASTALRPVAVVTVNNQ